MKRIIIRKPEFMRNKVLVESNVNLALMLYENLRNRGDISSSDTLRELVFIADVINEAAKYDGFFNLKDLMRWIDEH